MLTVTDAATEHLAALLDNLEAPEGVVARLVIQQDKNLAMQPGIEKPGDAVFKHGGRVVLLLDEVTALAMNDQILDVVETEDGSELSFMTLPLQ